MKKFQFCLGIYKKLIRFFYHTDEEGRANTTDLMATTMNTTEEEGSESFVIVRKF